jgi:hypothetical protein
MFPMQVRGDLVLQVSEFFNMSSENCLIYSIEWKEEYKTNLKDCYEKTINIKHITIENRGIR